MASKYKIIDHQAIHFITFATVQWIDLLTRSVYKDVIIDSLDFCIKNKGLKLYAYVIMTNHIHLIAAAEENYNLSDIIGDFKKFTSKSLMKTIQENHQESRKNWMIWLFKSAGRKNSNNKNFQIWQQDNRPIQLSTTEMIEQRLLYLHDNPVKERIVDAAEHYIYSSAIDYADGNGLLKVELI